MKAPVLAAVMAVFLYVPANAADSASEGFRATVAICWLNMGGEGPRPQCVTFADRAGLQPSHDDCRDRAREILEAAGKAAPGPVIRGQYACSEITGDPA